MNLSGIDSNAPNTPSEQDVRNSVAVAENWVREHRTNGRRVVAIQGLGFVGAAVAATVAGARRDDGEPCFAVIGIDLPTHDGHRKVEMINAGLAPIVSPDPSLPDLIRRAVEDDKNLTAVTSQEALRFADVIVVDVQLDVVDRADLGVDEIEVRLDSYAAAISAVGQHMRADALVLIETTVPPGTSERVVREILERERSARGIEDPLLLAHAAERVMPGPNYVNSINRFWRSFAGIDEKSADRAREFLSSFIDIENFPLAELPDPTSSELAKVLENSYRAMNIAFIHEWTLLAEEIGVNLFDVVNAIRVRRGTHDNIRFPGFGVGGYCLTKDSLLAQWSARELFGVETRLELTLQALAVNYNMPRHTLTRLNEMLDGHVRGRRICLLGVSYLPGVGDTRNSPAELFCDDLVDAGANVVAHDPLLSEWPERPGVAFSQDLSGSARSAEALVFAVAHRDYVDADLCALLEKTDHKPVIVDAANVIDDEQAASLRGMGCRLAGVGKGHWRKMGYQERKVND